MSADYSTHDDNDYNDRSGKQDDDEDVDEKKDDDDEEEEVDNDDMTELWIFIEC